MVSPVVRNPKLGKNLINLQVRALPEVRAAAKQAASGDRVSLERWVHEVLCHATKRPDLLPKFETPRKYRTTSPSH